MTEALAEAVCSD